MQYVKKRIADGNLRAWEFGTQKISINCKGFF